MLRPVEQSDISAIESIVTDPGITMMLDFPKRDYEEARTFVDWAARQWHYPVPKDRIFVIIRSDQIVGLIDLETLEEPDVFEIGWLLRPDRAQSGDCHRGSADAYRIRHLKSCMPQSLPRTVTAKTSRLRK